MQQANHPAAVFQTRHQVRNPTQFGTRTAVATNAEQYVIEEVSTVMEGLKDAEPLGRALAIEQGLGGPVSRLVLEPRNRWPEVMNKVIVLPHDQQILSLIHI